jgi:hypothetical protein
MKLISFFNFLISTGFSHYNSENSITCDKIMFNPFVILIGMMDKN